MPKDYIVIAYISGVHGVDGAVKLKSFSEAENGIESYDYLYDKHGNIYEIKSCKITAKNLLVKFKHIINRNQAEELKGTNLYIKAEQLAPLEEDEFYHRDLLNLVVKDINDNIYGSIIAIHNFGAGEILEIKSENRSSFFIPFKTLYVPIINVKAGFIVLSADALALIDI